MLIAFICLFICLYALPSIILAFLQIKHIKLELQKPAILLESQDYKQAGDYAIASLRLNILTHLFEILTFSLWAIFGLHFLSLWLESTLGAFSPLWREIALVLGFVIIGSIIEMPFSIYKTFFLDKKFGFSKQTPSLFIIDTLKSLALSVVIGGIIVCLLVFIIENVALWWFVGFLAFLGVVILANLIYPTLIAPLFNKFTPLNDENLKSRIESLMNTIGFKSNGIFVIDASRRDGRLNAYFGGLGKSKRVVLFDTLLDKISADGLIAILGHELGHFKHKDVLFNLFLSACVLFALFFIAGNLPSILFSALGLENNHATSLTILLLIAPIVSFWVMPLIGYFSRKAEYRADSYSVSLTNARVLKEALIRLVNENKTFPYSPPAYIFFHYTHPPLLERLKALGGLHDGN